MSRASNLSLFAQDLHSSGLTYPETDGSANQVIVTNGSGVLSFADQSGGLDSAQIISLVDSAYVQARQTSGGGGSVDSAMTINIVNDQLLLTDIGDIVGVDGNPGEYLQSDGNGNSSWTDGKLKSRQNALAMTLIFG